MIKHRLMNMIEEDEDNQVSSSKSNRERTQMSDSLIDTQVLSQMVEDTSAEVLPMLIDAFLEESATRMTEIQAALSSQDAKLLEFESHTLGSTALAMGARSLGNLSREVETHCVYGQLEQAFEKGKNLPTLLNHTRDALEKHKNSL